MEAKVLNKTFRMVRTFLLNLYIDHSNSLTLMSPKKVKISFMSPPGFTILLFLLVISCKQKNNTSDEPTTVSPSAFYDKNLKVTTLDTVKYLVPANEEYWDLTFNPRDWYCTLRNDSLFFYYFKEPQTGISNCGGAIPNLMIYVTKDRSELFHMAYGDFESDYRNIAYKLTLNNKDFAIGDTIHANIYLKAIPIKNGYNFGNNTLIFSGKVKLKIRDSNFDRSHLYEEKRRAKFYDLLQQRPDTITKLFLVRCNFTKIPKELNQFKNLEKLLIIDDDLSNADFSVLLDLKKLKSLGFQNCKLNKVPPQIFKLHKLEVLNLFWNNLTYIPDKVYSLTLLKDLNIGSNNLNLLSPKIANLKCLESLTVDATEIESYPDTITVSKNIKILVPYPKDKFSRIKIGMKKEEVINILGSPNNIQTDSANNSIYFYYSTKSENMIKSKTPTVIFDTLGIVRFLSL
jgi:SmpA / OmlA family/Leucine rich repeat